MPSVARRQGAVRGGKRHHFGLEVTSAVTWQGWTPSREYTKNITLKNVCMRTQKLKYSVPKSRFFSILYPQPVMLSAGTSFTLPVVFRPLENVTYKDKVKFCTNEGDFEVIIEGRLPEPKLDVPEQLDFETCAVEHYQRRQLVVKNVSELLTSFQVTCAEPFTVAPSCGVLEPFASITLTATFQPKLALVYRGSLVFAYGKENEIQADTPLLGISKYAYLTVKTNSSSTGGAAECELLSVVNFGKVPLGGHADRCIELCNSLPMQVPFVIEHPTCTNYIDTVFRCPQRSGIVPPKSSLTIPIIFTPDIVDTTSIDYFHVKPAGGICKAVVKCTASSKGPKTSLSSTSISFAKVDAGSLTTKLIKISNTSDVEAQFQFVIDSRKSVFQFEPERGCVPAKGNVAVYVHFQPTIPMIYYRKVTCILHNQEPQTVDLFGTCHTETKTPAVLCRRHIAQYEKHVLRHLSFNPPESLNEMLARGKLVPTDDGSLISPEDIKSKKMIEETEVISPMDEYSNDGYHCDVIMREPHVSLDVHHLDFGVAGSMNNVVHRSVTVTNHTHGKVIVTWITDAELEFSVSPQSLEIPPHQASSFAVIFNPRVPNQLFSAQLECYVYYKSARDFRLVEDSTLSPPWCLTLLTSGHTFCVNAESFIPRLICTPRTLIFPAVNVAQAAYRTVLLTNQADTPITFDIHSDPAGVYSVKPSFGHIGGRSHQILVVKMLPPEVATYKHTLKLSLNENEKHVQEIELVGSAETARVELENDGALFFKRTVVGGVTSRGHSVRNASRMPLSFLWQLHQYEADALHVEPMTGVITPSDNMCFTWSFKPNQVAKYMLKPRLVVWSEGSGSDSSSGKKQEFRIRAIGEGIIGEIKVDKVYMDFGTVLVGTTEVRPLELENNNDCDLHYRLLVEEMDDPASPKHNDPIGLTLDVMRGVLPARSRTVVYCSVKPLRRRFYQWTVSSQLLPIPASGDEAGEGPGALSDPQHLCHILSAGVFPLLSVTDARSSGRAAVMSKKHLWGLFSIGQLNTILSADPMAFELTPSAAKYGHCCIDNGTRTSVEFNFSAAPLGSSPCVIELLFENVGPMPCTMAFLFPPETKLQLDYWAERGDLDEEELHEMSVLDNTLFDVQPRRATLQPGEQCLISFTYRHRMAGTHRLSLLLKVAQGRELLLNFVGVTVEPDRCYLQYFSDHFTFTPVAVGEENPPTQLYELYNGGALSVQYRLDVSNILAINQENFGHPVFDCLNPSGELMPAHTAAIRWRFSPLEAKTYKVNIPILLADGQETVITFIGLGYEKRLMGDTMPVQDRMNTAEIPALPNVRPLGELCYLTEERLSLGNVPLFTKVRRLVAVANTSTKHAHMFSWHVTHEDNAQYVSVVPQHGILQPGASCVCKVTFTALGAPAFYDLDLICELKNEMTEMEHVKAVGAWEKEAERQENEFCITEKNVHLNQDQEKPSSTVRLRSMPISQTGIGIMPKRYQTLPPIEQRTIDEHRVREREVADFASKYWPRPEPPQPSLIHLSLTARTHDPSEFQRTFPELYSNFFVDQLLCIESFKESVDMAEQARLLQPITCLQAEYETVSEALMHVIRGLLGDTELHKSIEKVSKAPIPYFQQFVAERLASQEATVGGRSPTGTADSEEGMWRQSSEGRIRSLPEESAARSAPSSISRDAYERSPSHAKQRTVRSATDTLRSPAAADADAGAAATATATEDNMRRRHSASPRSTYRVSSSSLLHRSTDGLKTTFGSVYSRVPTSSSPTRLGGEHNVEQFEQEQAIKKMPSFSSMVEDLLDNVLTNILQEAAHGEFMVTARPRLVALPPRSASRSVSK